MESELDQAIARLNATCDKVLARIEQINSALRAKKAELEGRLCEEIGSGAVDDVAVARSA